MRMKQIKNYNIYFFIISLFLVSCNNKNQKNIKSLKNDVIYPENFNEFYLKFHSDSIFQMKRIKFPLKGYNIDDTYSPEDENITFFWEKDKWVFHNRPIKNDSINIELKNKKGIVEEVLSIPNSGVEIIREFKLIDNKWYLVFYGNQVM